MNTTASTRPSLRDHVHPGIRVFNVHRRRVYRVHDMHDDDRSALLIGRDRTRYRVTYGDLVRDYVPVQPYASQEPRR